MEIKDIHPYKKGADAVFKFFSDPDTVKTKHEALRARNLEIQENAESGGVHTIKTQREVPADSVPKALQTFLGEYNKVIQTEKWTKKEGGSMLCELDIKIATVPVSIKGVFDVKATAGGCENHVTFTIKSGIPFIGGTLEKFVGGDTKKAMENEFAYITKQLG